MRYKVEKKPVSLVVTFSMSKPGILSVRGYDKVHSNTVYFERKYGSPESPVKGRFQLTFSFPASFERLGIDAKDLTGKGKVKIEQIQAKPLSSATLSVKPQTSDFIRFAQEFAYGCGSLKLQTYGSDCGRYAISYLPVIRDYQTNEIIPTPARINHQTGLIEVSKQDFVRMTVPNRLMILLHEYSHVALNTTDEIECDLMAVKTCLELGYSRLECLYAVSKLFLFNANNEPRLRQEQERRVAMVKDFIEKFNPKLTNV